VSICSFWIKATHGFTQQCFIEFIFFKIQRTITFQKIKIKLHYLLYYYYLGTVLFLEEDHFVTEDFIHVLKLMEKEQEGVAKEVKNSNLEI